MSLTKLPILAVIIELTLLSVIGTSPTLAAGMPDLTSLSDYPITPKSFTMPNDSQLLPNMQKQSPQPWGLPYWLNGNICKDREVDTVCLTLQEANNLRWLIPANQNKSRP